jgi:hypothetical protein
MRNTTRTIFEKFCEITVRRPGGNVETIRHPTIDALTPAMWSIMCKQTKDAGRGECLSYSNREEPRSVALTLEQQREDLCMQLSSALDRHQAQAARSNASSIGPLDTSGVAAIEAEIAAFDAEYPQASEAQP